MLCDAQRESAATEVPELLSARSTCQDKHFSVAMSRRPAWRAASRAAWRAESLKVGAVLSLLIPSLSAQVLR